MPPNDPDLPRHRRVWSAYNRPYSGCGCLWSILIILFIWWILTWVFGSQWGYGLHDHNGVYR